MGFAEDIAKLSEQVRKRIDNVFGEEATKMALIVPFLSDLAYDVHDSSEVIPEYDKIHLCFSYGFNII